MRSAAMMRANMTTEPPATTPGTGRSFAAYSMTQFLGALNDNLFKLLLTFAAIRLMGPDRVELINALAGAVFVVPFLIFNAAAGALADRLSKSRITVAIKLAEIIIMAVGVAALFLDQLVLLFATLFLMAAQSAFFGPAKYGIIPEIRKAEQLSRANGLVTALTYVAIIVGTGLAPALVDLVGGYLPGAGIFCVIVALAGFWSSLNIERVPPAGKYEPIRLRFWRDIAESFRLIRHDRALIHVILASAYFLLIAAYLQLNTIPYGMLEMGLREETSAYLFLTAAIGIGMGSLLAGLLSGRHVELGVVPLGSFLLTGSVLALGLFAPRTLLPAAGLMLLGGMGAGLFIVPLDAFVQYRSPPAIRGRIVAAATWLRWVGVLIASVLLYLVQHVMKLTPAQGFIFVAALTFCCSLASFVALPDFMARFLLLLFVRTGWRIRIAGREHIPVSGPALLAANHASYMDAPLLLAGQAQRIRFMLDRPIYDRWLFFRPVFRLFGCVPVSGQDAPRRMCAAFEQVRALLEQEQIIGIFPEGGITRDGEIGPFRRGVEHILKDTGCPVVPVYLEGARATLFSYHDGKPRLAWRTPFRCPITLHFGPAMPAGASADEVRRAILDLRDAAASANDSGRASPP